jgi:hypothetical protein
MKMAAAIITSLSQHHDNQSLKDPALDDTVAGLRPSWMI